MDYVKESLTKTPYKSVTAKGITAGITTIKPSVPLSRVRNEIPKTGSELCDEISGIRELKCRSRRTLRFMHKRFACRSAKETKHGRFVYLAREFTLATNFGTPSDRQRFYNAFIRKLVFPQCCN